MGNFYGIDLYLEKLFVEEGEITKNWTQDFQSWITTESIHVDSVPSLEPNLALIVGVLLETSEMAALRERDINFYFCKVCAGQLNVVIETSWRREDALRNQQRQHTFNFINIAVAKARSPALQTGQLRRKALTLQDVDSSVEKVKKGSESKA